MLKCICNFNECRVIIGYILFCPLMAPLFIFKSLDDCIKNQMKDIYHNIYNEDQNI
jgi:hypothetical protein